MYRPMPLGAPEPYVRHMVRNEDDRTIMCADGAWEVQMTTSADLVTCPRCRALIPTPGEKE